MNTKTLTVKHTVDRHDVADLVRLANAVAAVRSHIDTGVLFEGYDGREPQRAQACGAMDELEAAARRVEPLLARLAILPPSTVDHL